MRGHVDGRRQRLGKALEPAVISSALGQLVQATLGILDLVAGREVNRCVIGDVDHLFADLDQRAADRQVIDGVAVASAASRARYWLTVRPPMSTLASRKVLSVIGVASLPARIRSRAS